jgi:AcrR family transcriptional regulator
MAEAAPDRNGVCRDRVSTPRRRADAMNNRARIIAAARTAIADGGGISLSELARRAGVSQGTLYRHSPTRVDLVAEVYRDQVHELTAAAPVLLAEHEPLVALSCWLNRIAIYARINRDFVDAVDPAALTMLLDAARPAATFAPTLVPATSRCSSAISRVGLHGSGVCAPLASCASSSTDCAADE